MSWVHKPRKSTVGGVVITVRDKISNKTKVVREDQEREMILIEDQIMNNENLYRKCHGKQENEPAGIVEREFSRLQTQIKKQSNNGPNILTGDLNAELKIDKGTRNKHNAETVNS